MVCLKNLSLFFLQVWTSTTTNLITGQESLLTGQVVTTYNSTFNGQTFANGLSLPEVRANSGEIIYVENRRLIRRAADQIEDIKLVIEFWFIFRIPKRD